MTGYCQGSRTGLSEPLLSHPWKGDRNIDFGVGATLQKAKGNEVSSTGLGQRTQLAFQQGRQRLTRKI